MTKPPKYRISRFYIFPLSWAAGLKGGRLRPAQTCQPRPTSLRFTPSRSPVLLSAPRSKSCSLSVSVISSTTPCSPFFLLFILCSEIPFAWTLARWFDRLCSHVHLFASPPARRTLHRP